MFKHLTGSDPVEIKAPIGRVWDVLAATGSYGEWNPFTTQVVTDWNVGSPVKFQVALGPLKLKQLERIELVDPSRNLVWGRKLGHRFLPVARRIQRLEAPRDDRCVYATTVTPSGLLNPLVVLLLGTLIRRGFDAMANALKARAENAVEG